jgi:tRNA A37 threonylcarbamoyladenosine dehydratase
MLITVVGVGALGSHLIQFLRCLDGVRFKVIDFDRVEQRNTRSQFHAKGGVGKNKVQHLAQTTQFLWGLKLQTIPHKLVSDNTLSLLGDADLVVDCLDNGDASRLTMRMLWGHLHARKGISYLSSPPCLRILLRPSRSL